MMNQNPDKQDNDIFQELYGENNTSTLKTDTEFTVRKTKTRKKTSGTGGAAVALLIVAAIVFGGFLLIRNTCIFGHDWQDATCDEPKFCLSCGTTEGEPLGHLPGKASCTVSMLCLNCNAVLQDAPGHVWRPAYGDCEHCTATIPESMDIPADALALNTGDVTHFYSVFAMSNNKWAPIHCNENAVLFSFPDFKPTWEDALWTCEVNGGRMAEISTPQIGNAVFAGLIDGLYADEILYFGLTDMEEEGQWRWLSGDSLSYTNWHSGQPDGGKNKNHAGFYGKYQDGSWRDGKFNEDIRYFICEWVLSNY